MSGGSIMPGRRDGDDDVRVLLSPGRFITDPDEAEALGLTVEARRLRAAGADGSNYLDTLNALLPGGLRFEWRPAERLPEDVVTQGALVSGASRAYVAEALAAAMKASRELDERRAAERRRYWSGPDRLERQILRSFGVTVQQIGAAPRSAFSSAYRQRQRNRVKRRRR